MMNPNPYANPFAPQPPGMFNSPPPYQNQYYSPVQNNPYNQQYPAQYQPPPQNNFYQQAPPQQNQFGPPPPFGRVNSQGEPNFQINGNIYGQPPQQNQFNQPFPNNQFNQQQPPMGQYPPMQNNYNSNQNQPQNLPENQNQNNNYNNQKSFKNFSERSNQINQPYEQKEPNQHQKQYEQNQQNINKQSPPQPQPKIQKDNIQCKESLNPKRHKPNYGKNPEFVELAKGKGIDQNEYNKIVDAAKRAYEECKTEKATLSFKAGKKIKNNIKGQWFVFVSEKGKKYDFSMSTVASNDFLVFSIGDTLFQVCRIKE